MLPNHPPEVGYSARHGALSRNVGFTAAIALRERWREGRGGEGRGGEGRGMRGS